MDQTTSGGITPPPIQQPSSSVPPQPTTEVHINETKQSSLGPVIGIVIVIILLIAGALYAWKSMPQNTIPSEIIATQQQTDPQTEKLMEVTTSTDPKDIEADLMNTNIENLDVDLGALLIEAVQ